MFLLQLSQLSKAFGTRNLFEISQLEIQDGERIGLVGPNGAGKTTLLELLYGIQQPDAGIIDRRCEIAYIPQSGDSDGRADGQFLRSFSLNGSACRSGGERTRLAIAAAFSQHTPLLLADEPTTNLDWQGVELLQQQLLRYQGATVLVSHDRTLLDGVCNTIWALEEGGLRVFPGSYSEWLAQRDRERAFMQFEYEQYREEKARLQQEVVHLREQMRGMRKAPKRMGNSEARLHKGTRAISQGKLGRRAATLCNRIDQMEPKERPQDLPQVRMALGAAHPVAAKVAARLEAVTVRYGRHTVLQNAGFCLPTGSHTVMLGKNGAGKSTLLKCLLEDTEHARLANGVKLGYFAQHHELLDPARTILENVRESSALPEHEVRTILANLYLAGDAVFKPVSVLSGGERAKVAFAKLLASDCNLLVLDEPTNHIDLYTVEALEQLLSSWKGTLLVVTHDRRLTERLAQRLLFVEDGAVRSFEGDWQDWQSQQQRKQKPADEMAQLIEQMRRAADAYQSPRPFST
ncbi:MAG: ABC-F family ATP-binding cassette domain-containing protein [Anaerotruncus sp.]|jgi:macrolide transport system ATP-binding/permease protein|nr:ABC-F family ATP-binding cassette domain-containing protein [Anaerotruncus sp.]